jgi:hypothetical protein
MMNSQSKRRFTMFTSYSAMAALLLYVPGCPDQSQSLDHSKSGEVQNSKADASAIELGIEYLMAQRGEDQIWHSPAYGNLKDGAAISALVIYCLSHQQPTTLETHLDQIKSAVKKLESNSANSKYITNPSGPDYSNYATAMYLIAVKQLGLDVDQARVKEHLEYLCNAQLNFESAGVDKGGWDYSGWINGPRKTAGTNVSISCVVCECLDKYKAQFEVQGFLKNAVDWAKRTQNPDGGFCFHPQRSHDGNKAGWETESRAQPNSYGSPTCDGIRLLHACGLNNDNPEFVAAISWLTKNVRVDQVPGFEKLEHTGNWEQGLLYYYFYSMSKCLEHLPAKERKELAKKLKAKIEQLQTPEGYWENPVARMREDDPLIATSFALIALGNCERILSE